MKIGVFGDSYADKRYVTSDVPCIWYNFLATDHNHSIDCFGESGSSILFSAELIVEKFKDYDLVIWCLTTPGRFSLPNKINGRNYHVTTAWDQCQSKDLEIIKKHSVCIDYLKYIFEWKTENFIGKALVHHVRDLCQNVMIMPCFPPPLDARFNLYNLCETEAQHYFPARTIPEIYKTYQDLRPGHITVENQKILAELVVQNLGPGVFETSYENFITPTQSIDQVFRPL